MKPMVMTILKGWPLRCIIKIYFWYRDYCNILVFNILNPHLSLNYGIHLFFLRHIKQGDAVLDIGCNRGDLTILLAEKASHIDAYDILAYEIEYAKVHNSRPNVTFNVQEAEVLINSLNKEYDVVVLSGLLTFLASPEQFLRKLSKFTNKILIRETKFDNEILVLTAREMGIKKSRWKEFSKKELVDLITGSGYKIIEDFDTYEMFMAAVPESLC